MATVNLSSIITPANVLTASNAETLTNKTINIASNTLTGVQPTLVSGTSIKTVNSTSLLGSGDIAISAGFTLGTPVNVSGTSVSITGIPAGAKQIVLMFNAVKTNAAVNKFIQLGDSSGFITTGYVAQEAFINSGATATDSFTDAWRVQGDASTSTRISGAMTFTLYNASTFTYVGTGLFSYSSDSKATTITSGIVSLTSILTQIRVIVTGTTYDTGSVNVAYI